MNPWEWVTTTMSAETLFTTLGLGVLALLFAADRILTKGGHLRRVADIVNGYEKLLAEKDANHARELAAAAAQTERVDESRQEWKAASLADRARADAATASVATMAASLDGIKHVLDALHTAAEEKKT